MARLVYGTISDQAGGPMPGLRVQAWDDDYPDGDDLMGTAVTDPNGGYRIDYAGGHWDPAPHNITYWRPDIFISVAARSVTGAWAHLAKSRVYEDHPLRNDRRIDLRVTVSPPEKKMTGFDPKKHGFKFVNQFVLQPSMFGVDLGSWNLGLCGGMSAAAVNRFNAHQAIPAVAAPPAQGTGLYNELLDRQIRSIPLAIIGQIYGWQSAPDLSHTFAPHSVGYRTKQEWPRLKRELDAGRPTQLVLIRVEGHLANISDNHQVVAIGYDWNPTTKDLTVFVYDPNRPATTQSLKLNVGLPRSDLNATDSTGARLRGFFINTAGPAAAA